MNQYYCIQPTSPLMLFNEKWRKRQRLTRAHCRYLMYNVLLQSVVNNTLVGWDDKPGKNARIRYTNCLLACVKCYFSVAMVTCRARHSDVDVDILFVVKSRRRSECRFTVTSVVTKEKPATTSFKNWLKISDLPIFVALGVKKGHDCRLGVVI